MTCYDMTILTRSTVHYIPLVVYYVVQGGLTLESVDEMLKCNYESNWAVFHVMPFNKVEKMIITFESVDEMLKRDHSNESC